MKIERAAAKASAKDGDAGIVATARTFELSRVALVKHMAAHLGDPPGTAAPKPKAAKVERPAPAGSYEEAEGPATSRSPVSRKVTARSELDEVLREIRDLLLEATQEHVIGVDSEGEDIRRRLPVTERATVLRTAISSIRLLGNLTGELGATESAIVTSAHWKRFEGELVEVLRAHPAALGDVVEWLEKKREAA